MALGGAMRQAYFGRVIFPAEIRASQNGGHYMTFDVMIDNLVKTKDKSRKSGRVSCLYIPRKDNLAEDRELVILANIFNKETGEGNLAGQAYNSVEVLVEGSLELAEAEGGGYWMNLQYVTIKVTDNKVLDLYKAATSTAEVQQQQQPVQQQQYVAPQQQQQQPVQQFQQPVQQQTVQQFQQQPNAAPSVGMPNGYLAEQAQTATQSVAAKSQVLRGGVAPQAQQAQQAQQAPSPQAASVKNLLQGAPVVNFSQSNPLTQ